jgi:hypothetical protein
VDVDNIFSSQAYSFQQAISAFGKVVDDIQANYKTNKFTDWPTVILSMLLHSTAISLFRLLPKEASGDSLVLIDRRSIATLIRNLVDTHDVIDLLCDPNQSPTDFNLHRDIMGYYLSGKLHAFHGKANPTSFFGRLDKTQDSYWKRIANALPDKSQKNRLKRGESLFYLTRKERIAKCCGQNHEFVEKVLADLSTYVHSVPPALWMKTSDAVFANDEKTRGMLTIWLRITNFYYARAINIVLLAYRLESPSNELKNFIDMNRELFQP